MNRTEFSRLDEKLLLNSSKNSNNIIDGNEDDSLIRQLPKELLQYVVKPESNQFQIEIVNRSFLYGTIHTVLATLCCPYSIFRMHVIKQGEIGLTQYGDEPEILGPGRHVLLSPWNSFVGKRKEIDDVIQHGPINIVKVELGQLGYGIERDTGKPLFLSRGKHIIKSTTFVWKKFINLRDPRTILDNLEIIRVETGNVGYCFRNGQLVILRPGLHLITPPDRFVEIVSTQLSILDLPLAVHETSDYVPLAIKAAVFYRITDPDKALSRIRNITQQILETSIATLAGIIRSSSLSDVASRSQPVYKQSLQSKLKQKYEKNSNDIKEDDNNNNNFHDYVENNTENNNDYMPPSAPPFFQFVHDEFIQQLHDHVLEEWGIEIQNIRIESLKINDNQLQKDISAQAIDVSKQHNKYIMLQKQKEIAMVEASTRANKMKIDVDAENNAVKSKAQAEADAVIIRAKADNEAIKLRGEGEAEYSRIVENTKLGRDLALLKLQTNALSGLQQVAYVPHLPSLLATNSRLNRQYFFQR